MESLRHVLHVIEDGRVTSKTHLQVGLDAPHSGTLISTLYPADAALAQEHESRPTHSPVGFFRCLRFGRLGRRARSSTNVLKLLVCRIGTFVVLREMLQGFNIDLKSITKHSDN